MGLPRISFYGINNNSLEITIGSVKVWFSYTTPIAFKVDGDQLVVRRNVWSNTTGRHMNLIDGGNKDDRVNADTFKQLWNVMVKLRLSIELYNNYLEVTIGSVKVWFSYTTPIAFKVDGDQLVVRRNVWSNTTGRHMNFIDGGKHRSRVNAEVFERLWNDLAEPCLIPVTDSNLPWVVGLNDK